MIACNFFDIGIIIFKQTNNEQNQTIGFKIIINAGIIRYDGTRPITKLFQLTVREVFYINETSSQSVTEAWK